MVLKCFNQWRLFGQVIEISYHNPVVPTKGLAHRKNFLHEVRSILMVASIQVKKRMTSNLHTHKLTTLILIDSNLLARKTTMHKRQASTYRSRAMPSF